MPKPVRLRAAEAGHTVLVVAGIPVLVAAAEAIPDRLAGSQAVGEGAGRKGRLGQQGAEHSRWEPVRSHFEAGHSW